jgi:hypothetical protein
MKKYDAPLLKVFLYGLPVVVLGAVLYACCASRISGSAHFLNGVAGLVFAVWMLLSVYLTVRLMISGSFRDHTLTKLTLIRERDEREAMLTGKAVRITFLTSLAILIFLFCLSCFRVSIYTVPPERAVDGKTGIVSLGLGFDLLEHPKRDTLNGHVQREILSYTGLPISATTVILMLIIWHIASYNFSMRRLSR